MRNEIIKSMFKDNSAEFAGYWNIVNKLVEDKVCITTETARDIDFGSEVSEYIQIEPYEKGVGLVKLILEKNYLVYSNRFEEIRCEWIDEEVSKISSMMKEIEKSEYKIRLLNTCGK